MKISELKGKYDFPNIVSKLNGFKFDNKHTEKSRGIIVLFLILLSDSPKVFDGYMSVVSKEVVRKLLDKLKGTNGIDSDINISFALVYRVVMDVGITEFNNDVEDIIYSCQQHILVSYDSFDNHSRREVDYVNRFMPLDVLKRITDSDAFSFYKQVSFQFQDINKKTEEWAEYIDKQQEKVNGLHEQLVEKENAYNFVGLYHGFQEINREKKKELSFAFWVMFIFGMLMLIFSGVDIYLFGYKYSTSNVASNLYRIIPYLTLMLILIYFFRISLFHFRTIKTQITQLRLRMSLCQFIQSYAEYSKDLQKENGGLLSKFEDIVFSNIFSTEEKIPSAYDGIDQIASLIGSIKKK